MILDTKSRQVESRRPSVFVLLSVTGVLITASLSGCAGGNDGGPDPGSDTRTVPPSGGTIELEETARVTFPAGAFMAEQTVELTADTQSVTAQDFEQSAVIFTPNQKIAYDVRIEIDGAAPATDVMLELQLPESYLVQDGMVPRAFSQIWQDSGEDQLYNFELLDSSYQPGARTVTTTLPSYAFTNRHRSDGVHEAVITIAQTPGTGMTGPSTDTQQAQQGDDCDGNILFSPLEGVLTENRPFNVGGTPHPITGSVTPHRGVDLAAADGDNVLAVGDGTIRVVDYQFNEQNRTGWGHYIVLDIEGGSVLYAHLEEGSILVEANGQVEAGDIIARSDSSGGVTGPHLHLEYAPDGRIFNRPSKVDPMPCLEFDLSGEWDDSGRRIQVAHSGATVTATFVEPYVCEFEDGSGGQEETDFDFEATLESNLLTGQTSVCNYGADNPEGVGIKLTDMALRINQQGDELMGTWRNTLTDEDVPMTITRIQ